MTDLDLELRLSRDEVREWKHNYEQVVLDRAYAYTALDAAQKRLARAALIEQAAADVVKMVKRSYPELLSDDDWPEVPALIDALEST